MPLRGILTSLAFAALAGCSLFGQKGGLDGPYVRAAAAMAPVPAVRVLVSRDGRDRSSQTVDSVELIAPGGHRYAATGNTRPTTRQPFSYRTPSGVQGSTNLRRVPDDFGLVMPVERRGEIVSTTAVIEIPDVEAYRRTWDQWTILVVLSGPEGKKRKIKIAAPPIQ